MNRGIHGSVFAASLFLSGLSFAQGVAANRPMAGDVLVPRAGRIAINVTATDNVRSTNITDGDRQVKIDEGPDGIRMSVTDNDNGKLVQKDYEAKSIEEMRKEQPEAAQIYDKYMTRGRAVGFNGNGRIMRLTPPAIDDNEIGRGSCRERV